MSQSLLAEDVDYLSTVSDKMDENLYMVQREGIDISMEFSLFNCIIFNKDSEFIDHILNLFLI
jgi:hypothetical protein